MRRVAPASPRFRGGDGKNDFVILVQLPFPLYLFFPFVLFVI